MERLRVEATRGGQVETVHEVDAVMVAADGRRLATAGQPDLPTFWRSAVKPFQALPLVQDGAADQFGFGPDALALTCASHSAEPEHRALALQMLARVGASEADLACGPHPSLSPEVHEAVVREGINMTPVWSNCSGKHAGLLALAHHHGWSSRGYESDGHPVQERVLEAILEWTGLQRGAVVLGVDGCTALSVGGPLDALARGWARLGEDSGAGGRLREAMLAHPHLVAGSGRLDTEVLAASGGRVVVKVGADGVYGAALPGQGMGLALKVRSGDMRAAGIALAGLLLEVMGDALPGNDPLRDVLVRHAEPVLRNTRGTQTGVLRLAGGLRQ